MADNNKGVGLTDELPSLMFEEDALFIRDDIEIIDGDTSEFIAEGEGEGQAESKLHGFGYKLSANADGTLKYPEVELDKEMIRSGLSHIARTLDTFEFAYSRYDGRNRSLTKISALQDYVHMRVIDLSGNRIKSFKSLAPVKHLLVLVVNDNLMQSLEEIPHLPFLQALSAKRNRLKSAEGLFPNSLTFLQLSFNKISNLIPFDADSFPNLTVLELRGNSLETLEGLNLPTLIRLFVAKNKLKSLDGLGSCINLTHLHARENMISKLEDFPRLEQLEYVNLRYNSLKRFTQTKFLGNSPNIRTLIAMENPIAVLNDYKTEMIAANPNLKRLDKQPVTEMDLMRGRQIRGGREKGTIPQSTDDSGILTPPMPTEEAGEDGEEYQQLNNSAEPSPMEVEVRKATT